MADENDRIIDVLGRQDFNLFDRDGNLHVVGANQAERLALSGVLAFEQGTQVPIVEVGSGRRLVVPAENFRQMMIEGRGQYRLFTPDMAAIANAADEEGFRRHLAENYGGTAFTLGLVDSLDPTGVGALVGLPSLSRVVREALGGDGTRERESSIAQENMELDIAGRVLGFIPGLLTGSTEARLLGGAGDIVEGVSALSRTRALAEGTQAGLTLRVGDYARMALNSAGVESELALGAARAGTEGAVAGLVDANQRAIRDDAELYSNIVLAEGGLGAALGMGADLLMRGAGAGFRRVRQRGTTEAERLLRQGGEVTAARQEFDNILGDDFPQDVFDLEGLENSFWREAVGGGAAAPRPEVRALLDPEKRRQIVGLMEQVPRIDEIAARSAEAARRIDDMLDDLGRVGPGSTKSRSFTQAIQSEALDAPVIQARAVDVLRVAKNTLSRVDEAYVGVSGAGTRRALISKVDDALEFFMGKPQKGADPVTRFLSGTPKASRSAAETFDALDVLRTEISKAKQTGDIVGDELDVLVNRIDEVLEDGVLFGKVGDLQQQYRRATDDLITSREIIRNKFGHRRGRRWEYDAGKFSGHFTRTDSKGYVLGEELDTYLFGASRFTDYMESVYRSAPKSVKNTRQELEILKRTLRNGRAIMEVANRIGKAAGLENKFSGITNIGMPTVGFGVGFAAGGPVGGALGAMAANVAGQLAFRPISTLTSLGIVQRSSQRILRRMNKAFTRLRRRLEGLDVSPTKRTIPLMVRPLFSENLEDRREAYRNSVMEIQELAANPNEMGVRLAANLAGSSLDAPRISSYIMESAMRGVEYLAATLPRYELDPLDPDNIDFVPSNAEMAAWQARYRAVMDPVSVIEDLADFTIQEESVEAMRVYTPRLYNEMVAGTHEVLSQHRSRGRGAIPYQAKIFLGIALGTETDTSMRGDFLITSQSQFAQTSGQAQAVGSLSQAGRGTHTLAGDMSTEFQRSILGPPPR